MRIKRMGGLVYRIGRNYRIMQKRNRFYIECLIDNCHPRTLRIGHDAVRQFDSISEREFDHACVLSGCGVFQKEAKL